MEKKKRRIGIIVAVLLAVVFSGLLVVGIAGGDVDYVLKNAKSFCFS